MDVAIPTSPEAAQSRRVEIAATQENKTREELNAERDSVREKLNYARAQRDEVLKHVQDLQPVAASGDVGRGERRVEKADHILNRWRPLLARRAAGLQVEPELQGVREARQEVQSQRRGWQARIQQATKLAVQITEGEARTLKISGELKASYEAAGALLDGRTAPWTEQLERSMYGDVGRMLSEAFEAHGGDQVRTLLNSLENEIGACERELKIRDKSGLDAVALSNAILNELGIGDTLTAQPTLDELDDLAARLQKVEFEDKPKLESRVKALHMRVGALQDTRARLERELGLEGESVDREAAREELEKERLLQEDRKYGAEIVLRARKRIVQKILPATMDYMRRILPQLTRDRYHDAELDPETYKIKVWDERAGQSGAWKEKNIFSGGTKDQFSLALRLAFALATLPQERGTSPGFIFLDEPQGSFDDERAAALLYLLTEGEIARAFDQIFLISHVRVQEDRFTHQIRLENGAVVESSQIGRASCRERV
jgi:DNA repair exonuclease SbcCD ATPase subunit